MIKPGKIVAIIPARGGSKGLPRKNILPLAGKPLIAHTIMAALNCPLVSRSLVSTEDPEIGRTSVEWGAEVVERPASLAGDTTPVEDAVRQTLEFLEDGGDFPEYFVLLQPTSPLRTEAHLQECIAGYFESDARCAISVTVMKQSPYKAFVVNDSYLQPLYDAVGLHRPRQLLPPVYAQNGAIYLMPARLFLEKNSFFAAPAMPYYMPAEASVDIDSPVDLKLTEIFLKYNAK